MTTLHLHLDSTGKIGRVSAIDPDFERTVLQDETDICEDNCGLRYSILSGAFSSFTIDINTGEISVTSGGKPISRLPSHAMQRRFLIVAPLLLVVI